MKNAFIIKTKSGGNIAVTSNIKKAVEILAPYKPEYKINYREACKEIKEHGFYMIYSSEDQRDWIEITEFTVNHHDAL